MSTSRLNSEESIRTASRMIRAFGSWGAIERAADIDKNGVYVVKRSDAPDRRAPSSDPTRD